MRSIFRNLRHLVLMVAILWLAIGPSLAMASTVSGTAGTSRTHQAMVLPARNPNPAVRVEDAAGLLTARQFQVLNASLDRLARLGTEAVVFFRESTDESTSQTWLAEDLRLAWDVESAVGARNGLVVVVSVDRTNPANSSIVTSSGINTFPIRQLTEDGFDRLVEEVALPHLQAGDAFSGVRDLLDFTLGTVIDRVGALTERQLVTLDGDLRRLGQLGLPTLVYVQPTSDQNDGQDLANSLLAQWAVGTDPLATRAMVLVITVDQSDAENSSIAYASGEDSFPIRQLTSEGYEAILSDEALPALRSGDVYLALAYAIRRAINFAEYSPPEPAPLTEIQNLFEKPLTIAAAVLVQIALLLYLLIPAVMERKLTLIPSSGAMTVYILITVLLAVVVGVLGVLDHNRAATLSSLGVVVMATAVLPLFRAGLLEVQHWLTDRRSRPNAQGPQELTNAE